MELCRRYSNRPELLNSLVSVLGKIKDGTADDSQPASASVCGKQPGVWRIGDRLTDQDVAALLDAYRRGTTAFSLAAHYGLGLTTVKRLLREHGVRRR